MNMPALSRPKTSRSYRPNNETLAGTRATITRLTGVRLDASHVANLDDGECRELVELTNKLHRGEDGQLAGTNRMRLSPKETRRWEALIEGAIEAPGHFRRLREQADTKQTLAHLARKAMMPPTRPALLPAGSVVLPPDLWEHLAHGEGTILGFEEVAVLVVVAASLENAGALGPHSRVEPGEDDTPVLVLHADFGFGARLDPDDRLASSWKRALSQLEANDWLVVTTEGQEIRVSRGRLLKKAVKEQT
jgi:hypothetical protein